MRGKARLAPKDDNLAAICEVTVRKMWYPRNPMDLYGLLRGHLYFFNYKANPPPQNM
jgi:hypothetical protein